MTLTLEVLAEPCKVQPIVSTLHWKKLRPSEMELLNQRPGAQCGLQEDLVKCIFKCDKAERSRKPHFLAFMLSVFPHGHPGAHMASHSPHHTHSATGVLTLSIGEPVEGAAASRPGQRSRLDMQGGPGAGSQALIVCNYSYNAGSRIKACPGR
jgi:hypothetical protein